MRAQRLSILLRQKYYFGRRQSYPQWTLSRTASVSCNRRWLATHQSNERASPWLMRPSLYLPQNWKSALNSASSNYFSPSSWWFGAPKGFEDFFPDDQDDGAKNETPARKKEESKVSGGPQESASSPNQTNKKRTNQTFESYANRLRAAEEKQKNSNRSSNNKNNSEPPFDGDANWPGVLALLALLVALRQLLEDDTTQGTEITFVEFRNRYLNRGRVEKLVVVNNQVCQVVLKNQSNNDPQPTSLQHDDHHEQSFSTATEIEFSRDHIRDSTESNRRPNNIYFYIGSVEHLEEKLNKAQEGLPVEQWTEIQYITKTNWLLEGLKTLPFLAFMAALYFGSKSLGIGGGAGGASGIFGIGKSNAKKIKKEDINVTFNDVAGCQEAKKEIMEFVDFLKDSKRFTKLGAKIPKGALLCGPPGTGKTLLAKAVAGEAGVPFYSISGSDFIEMFVGVGPSRVRDLFKTARQNSPCIVFIDEIDAVGRQRGRGGFAGGNDERENTLNQLLVELDGFNESTNIVVLAGTNRVDILDEALTRPGRFDRQVQVDKPDLAGRREIFQVHLKNLKLEGKPDDYAGRLAGLTPGFAGADIANICNEAAIVAARRKGESINVSDFEKATDRIIGGLASNKIMSDNEKSIVAHHEAGHAVAGWFLEHADPLLKVTIIPRASGALGYAQYLPKEVFLRSEEQIMDLVCMALAGRASEEVFFGKITTGASDDLRRVTQLVYSMIKDFGMIPEIGQLSFPQKETMGDNAYSDSTAEAMDDKARSIVDEAYQRTVQLITQHKEETEKVAKLLLDKETITHDDIVDLVGPRPFKPDAAYQEYVTQRKQQREVEDAASDDDNKTIDGTLGLA